MVEDKMDKRYISRGVYVSPRILRTIPVESKGTILTASIHEKMTVETTGHEVKNYDWSDYQPFNHTWE